MHGSAGGVGGLVRGCVWVCDGGCSGAFPVSVLMRVLLHPCVWLWVALCLLLSFLRCYLPPGLSPL